MIFRSPFGDVDPPRVPLTEFVLERAGEWADRPALIDGLSGRELGFGQLATGVRHGAAGLAKRGFRKRDVFAMYAPNLPEYAICFHAVASLGGVVTTINPLYTVEELAHQLNDARAKYLVTVAPFLNKAREAASRSGVKEVFIFGEAKGATPFDELLANDGDPPRIAIDPLQDLVVLPYSSGTAGRPKGVMLTHYNLVANIAQAHAIERRYTLTEADTVAGVLPFFHIFGMTVILNYGVYCGARVITMARFDFEQFLGLVQKYGITYAHLVPPIMLGLAKHPAVDRFDLSSLRGLLSGAAPLGGDVAQTVATRLGCPVIQGYGLTETSPTTHTSTDIPERIRPASAGQVIPGTEAMIVDVETGRPLGRNAEGEIWVRGPQVMRGYLNNPEATSACLDADGWFHTGDIGKVDDDDYLYVVDRVKELIKYKGMQVAPAELEALLLTHPQVNDAAVIPSSDEEAGEVPKAFVVVKAPVTAEELMTFVAEQVAPHKRIRSVEFVDAIPKSLSGKILRRVLVERERERVAG
jgi:acyl-CoA synthetase (AMP-forming)/AMP-acid ligase II